MFIRYAKHYLADGVFAWNVGDGPAYGATSTLHLLVVTAVRAATTWSDAMVLTAVSLAAGLAAAALMTAIGLLVLDSRDRCREWLPWLVPPLIFFSGAFRANALSGMDATVSMMCNAGLIAAVVVCSRRPSAIRLAVSIAAGYLSVLARPDNGVYALLFPPLFLLASDRTTSRYAASYVVTLSCVLGGDLLLKRHLFGTALPLPFYAKQGGAYLGYLGARHWNPVASSLDFVSASFPFLAAVAAFARKRTLPALAAILAPVGITLLYFFSVLQIMGQDARYQLPSLPFVVLAAFVAVRDRAGDRAPTPSIVARAVVIGLVAIAVRPPVRSLSIRAWEDFVIDPPTVFEPRDDFVIRSRSRLPQLGWWEGIVEMTAFARTLPRDTVLAASEYGYLGAEQPSLRIIDLVGLHDPRFADHGFSADRIFAGQPDVLWLPHQDYSFAIKQLLDAPEFTKQYEYYPGAYNYGVALRKFSPRSAAVRAAFVSDFLRVYGRPADEFQASAVLYGLSRR